MKKIIQIVSFLSLALIFGGVSANGQLSVTKVDATIPFDFTVGDKSFSAGNYVIRLAGNRTTVSFEIRDENGKTLHNGFVMSSGDVAKAEPELVFDKVGGQRSLSKILIENAGYAFPEASKAKQIASSKRKAEDAAKN